MRSVGLMIIVCVCSVTVNASSLFVGQGLGLNQFDHDGSGYTAGAFDGVHPDVVDIAVVDGGMHVVSSTGITFYSYDAVGDTFTEGGSSDFSGATGIAVAANGSIYTSSSSAGVNQWTYSGGAYTAGGAFTAIATDIAVDLTGAIHVAQSEGVSGWTYSGGAFTQTAWLGDAWAHGSAIAVDATSTVHYGKNDGMAGLTYDGSSYAWNGNWFATPVGEVNDIEIDEATGMIWVAHEGGVNAINKANYAIIASQGAWGAIDDVFVDSDGKAHLGKFDGIMGVDIVDINVIAYDGHSWFGINEGVNVITGVPPEPPEPPIPGLVAWYKCDDAPGTGGLADSSGNYYDAGFWGDAINTGTSVQFPYGDNSYVFSPYMVWDSNDSWTWMLWTLNVSDPFSGDPDDTGALMNRTIKGHHQSELEPGTQYLVKYPLGVQHQPQGTGVALDAGLDASLADDIWHHVAVSYDQPTNEMKIYFDGVIRNTKTIDADGQMVPGVNYYYFAWGLGSGGWLTGELKDIRVYDTVISDEDIALVVFGPNYPGDIDDDNDVDANDLKLLTDEWLDGSTLIPEAESLMENGDFEDYVEAPASPNLADYWQEYWMAPNQGSTSSSVLSLLTSSADAHDGNQAMRWVYDTNDTSGLGLYYTEILYTLDSTVDLSTYDEIRIWIKRHSGNSHSDILFVRLFNGGVQDANMAADSYLYENEGSTYAYADQWKQWTIDLNNMDGWLSYNGYDSKADITALKGLLIGVSDTVDNIPGTGTIDIDDITLVTTAHCSDVVLDSDLNGDCITNFIDYSIFAEDWLKGK